MRNVIKTRREFYKSQAWKEVRNAVLYEHHFICSICGEPAIDVHHIIPLNDENFRDSSIAFGKNNLIPLCRRCHNAEHGRIGGKSQSAVRDGLGFDSNGRLIEVQKADV